jgi:hypothetical protein
MDRFGEDVKNSAIRLTKLWCSSSTNFRDEHLLSWCCPCWCCHQQAERNVFFHDGYDPSLICLCRQAQDDLSENALVGTFFTVDLQE